MAIPFIDMVRKDQNINRLRKNAGVSVKDLQGVFGFATPQQYTNGSTEQRYQLSITW